MSDERDALFAEKDGYRRRRLTDAARLLPILGALLFLIPLLWRQDGDGAAGSTTSAMLFVFGVWFGLVLLAAVISYFLSDTQAGGAAAADAADTVAPDTPGGRVDGGAG